MFKLFQYCAFALAILGSSGGAWAADTTVGALSLQQPWSRATPAKAATADAFLTIANAGGATDRLIGGSSPAAQQVQIHEMGMDKNVMTMREMNGGLPIQAGATVKLQPDGYHIMLVGLVKPLKQGDTVQITLQFEKAGKVTVDFPIAAIGARTPDGGNAR